jgi:RNA 2',3'-cyclic 3'-phosphodiesterase
VSEVSKLRLFVAVPVPQDHLVAVDAAVAPLKDKISGARWAPIANQHVTLKFLGATPSDRLPAVEDVITSVARSHAPREVTLEGIGAFPREHRARVIWAGIDDPAGLLGSLAAGLAAGFEPLGYRTEKRAFTPHLTLARLRVPKTVDLGTLEVDLPPFVVDHLRLYRSRLHPKGATYEVIRRFELGGGQEDE